ncbi:hypothetical protein V8G61_14285 [Gaetbulibacter sp. M240]|uniref:hypothetical protein n=1 Tax=Gaetbulibacter sp. M240 TaxID=3126511 RepID=UPI00374E2BD1
MKVLIPFALLFLSLTSYSQTEDDCVFNYDVKGLTMEWLQQLNQTNFVWDKNKKLAEKIKDGDTLRVSKVGCVHFSWVVEVTMIENQNTLENTDFWLKKAMGITELFDLKYYHTALKLKNFKLEKPNKNQIVFDIKDDDITDNLFYLGVIVLAENNIKKIIISKYLN